MANDEAQDELDFDADVDGESKAERFSRVVNPRLKTAVKRLRMIRQMFEGANANNYEFTDEQARKLSGVLQIEVQSITDLMDKRLNGGKDTIATI